MFETTRFKIPRTEKVQNIPFPQKELFENYDEIKAIFNQISELYGANHIEIVNLLRKYLTGLDQGNQYAAELNFLVKSLQSEQLSDTPVINNPKIIKSCKSLLGSYLRVMEGENPTGVSDSDDSMKLNHYISSPFNTQTYEQSLAIQPIYNTFEKDLQSSTELKANLDSEFVTPAEQGNPKDLFDDIYGKISASADLLGQSRQKIIETLISVHQNNKTLVQAFTKLLDWQDEYYFGGNGSGSDNIKFDYKDIDDLLLLQGYVSIYFDETVLSTKNNVSTTQYVEATSTNTYKSTQNRPSAQTPLSSTSANVPVNSAVNTNHTSNVKYNQPNHLLQKLGDLKNSVRNNLDRFKNFGQNTLRQTFTSKPKNTYHTVKTPANNPVISNTIHTFSNTSKNIKTWYTNTNWIQKTGIGLASVLGVYGVGITSLNTAMSNLTGRQFHAITELANMVSSIPETVQNTFYGEERKLEAAQKNLDSSFETYYEKGKQQAIKNSEQELLQNLTNETKMYESIKPVTIKSFTLNDKPPITDTVLFDSEKVLDTILVVENRISLSLDQKQLILKYIELQNISSKSSKGYTPISETFDTDTFNYLYENKILQIDKTGNSVTFDFKRVREYVRGARRYTNQYVRLGYRVENEQSLAGIILRQNLNLAMSKVAKINTTILREQTTLKRLQTEKATTITKLSSEIETQQKIVDKLQVESDNFDLNTSRDFNDISDDLYKAATKLSELRDDHTRLIQKINFGIYEIENRIQNLNTLLKLGNQEIAAAKDELPK